MKAFFKEFREFIDKGNVLDLAVAVVLGGAFAAIIKAVQTGIINPLIAAVFGKPGIGDVGFTINNARFSIGAVVDGIIYFVIVALLLFLIIKAYNKITRRHPTAAATEIDLLTEIRDELRRRA